jgi:hypothetical protein
MTASDDWKENVNAKVEAQKATKERARVIVEISEDLTAAVKSEVARIFSEEVGPVLDAIHEASESIRAGKGRLSRDKIVAYLDGLYNRLTIIRAAYLGGALPKDVEGERG